MRRKHARIIRIYKSKWRVSLRSKFKNKFATRSRPTGCRVLKSTRNLFLRPMQSTYELKKMFFGANFL